MTGKPGRRGDGTFGELVPAAVALTEKGMLVARGPITTIEIGAETKILAKAMIKQIDRVINDLVKSGQSIQERRRQSNLRCVCRNQLRRAICIVRRQEEMADRR